MLSRGDWVYIQDCSPKYDGQLGFIVHDEGGNVCTVELVDRLGWNRRCGKDRLIKLDPSLYKGLKFVYGRDAVEVRVDVE